MSLHACRKSSHGRGNLLWVGKGENHENIAVETTEGNWVTKDRKGMVGGDCGWGGLRRESMLSSAFWRSVAGRGVVLPFEVVLVAGCCIQLVSRRKKSASVKERAISCACPAPVLKILRCYVDTGEVADWGKRKRAMRRL